MTAMRCPICAGTVYSTLTDRFYEEKYPRDPAFIGYLLHYPQTLGVQNKCYVTHAEFEALQKQEVLLRLTGKLEP